MLKLIKTNHAVLVISALMVTMALNACGEKTMSIPNTTVYSFKHKVPTSFSKNPDFTSDEYKSFMGGDVFFLGMVCRFYFPQFSRRISKPIFYFGFACLFYPMISVFKNFAGLIDPSNIFQSTSAILLNVTMMCVGAGLGTLFGLSRSQSRTLSVEVGIQNFALVMVVILIFLKDLTLITPAVFYLPSMYLSAFALSYFTRKHRNEKSGVKLET